MSVAAVATFVMEQCCPTGRQAAVQLDPHPVVCSLCMGVWIGMGMGVLVTLNECLCLRSMTLILEGCLRMHCTSPDYINILQGASKDSPLGTNGILC